MARGSHALVGLLAKGKQNGIMDEPRFEVYMRHWYPPDPNIAEIPGEWRAEKTWPPANTHTETLFSRAESFAARCAAARLRFSATN